MIEVTVRFARRMGSPPPAQAVAVDTASLARIPSRVHYSAVWDGLSVFAAEHGPSFVFGPSLEQIFEPDEILIAFDRYRNDEQVFVDRRILPVPDFPAHLLLADRAPVESDSILLIGRDEAGTIVAHRLRRSSVRPFAELLDFTLSAADRGRCLDPGRLLTSLLRRRPPSSTGSGVGRTQSSQRSLPQSDERSTPEQRSAPEPAAEQPVAVDLARPAVRDRQALAEAGAVDGIELSAFADDEPDAWWVIFLRLLGLTHLAEPPIGSPSADLRRVPDPPSPLILREASICLVNCLWRNRARLDDLARLTERVPWVRQRMRAVHTVLTARDDPGSGVDGTTSLKVRWLCAWLGARHRFDYFWAFEQKNRIMTELVESGLSVGRDVPEMVRDLSTQTIGAALGGNADADAFGLLKRLTPSEPLDDRRLEEERTRVRFKPGELIEQPATKPPLPLNEIEFPDTIHDRRAVSALIGALGRLTGETVDGARAATILYFDFLERATEEINRERTCDMMFFQLLRTELHGNLVRLANHSRFRPRVKRLLQLVDEHVVPHLHQSFYRHQIELLSARVTLENSGDFSGLLGRIRQLTTGANPNSIDTRDLLMECLAVLASLPAEEKMGVVSAMIGCVEENELDYIGEQVRFNLHTYLGTLHVDPESFVNTYRRWEGWRIRKVVEEDLEALREQEFVLGV